MPLDIDDEICRIDDRLKVIEPLLYSGRRRVAGENRKRVFSQDHSSTGFGRNSNVAAEDDAQQSEGDSEPPTKRIVESVVVTPVSASSSREKRIQDLDKCADNKDKTRNRRFFNNILGTLGGTRQRDLSATKQSKKLEEIEEKLAANKKIEEAKMLEEKENCIRQKREAELELLSLQRNKAILQYAGSKIAHYELLKNAIQTKTKPVIFFMPAKHNVRSLELLNASQASIDKLIETRKAAVKEELLRDCSNRKQFSRVNRYAGHFRKESLQDDHRVPMPVERSRSRSFSRSDSEESVFIADEPAEPVVDSVPNIESSNPK